MTSAFRKYQNGSSEQIAKIISDYVISRRSDYDHALIKTALVPIDGGLRPLMSKIELLYKGSTENTGDGSGKYVEEYNDIILVAYKISIDAFLGLLSSISSERRGFYLPDNQIRLDVTENAEYYLLNSKSHYGYGYHQWPCCYATFHLPQLRINANYQIVAKRGLPVYPDIYSAITVFLNLSSKLEHHHTLNELIIIIPDFRARIEKVRISGNKITLAAEAKTVPLSAITAKMYLAKDMKTFQSGDLKFDLSSTTVSCQADFAPEEVTACILDENDDILDLREHHLNWSHYNPDIVVEAPSAQIEELIKRGESEDVEFKREPGNDFLESFVSFANSRGGMILLGVDNNGKIVGYDEDLDKLRDKITGKVLSNIQPGTIKFTLQRVEFESSSLDDKKQPIIVITVYEGSSKPYYLRDKGILIRHGATDSWITPSELDEIYAKRTGNRNTTYI
jgi:hypothetical protein